MSVLHLLRQMLDVGERWEQSSVQDQSETAPVLILVTRSHRSDGIAASECCLLLAQVTVAVDIAQVRGLGPATTVLVVAVWSHPSHAPFDPDVTARAGSVLHRVLACERAGVHTDDRETVADYLAAWIEHKAHQFAPRQSPMVCGSCLTDSSGSHATAG